MIRALWTLLRAHRGAMPDPRVAEAISQQRAVTRTYAGGSVRAHRQPCYCDGCYRETLTKNAQLFADCGLYDMAAHALIAASGNGIAKVVDEEVA